MENIKLKSFLLKEEINISDILLLEKISKEFAEKLVKTKIISTRHKDLTASDVVSDQYVEDITEVVRNEVIHWVNTTNARGGR